MFKARNDNLIQLIPSTTNKFETLNNLEEDEETIREYWRPPDKDKKKQIVNRPKKPTHKILILGDKSRSQMCESSAR